MTPTPVPSTTAPPSSPGAVPRPTATSSPTPPRQPRNNSEREFSCDMASDGVPVCEGDVPASVGEYRTPSEEIERQSTAESEAALQACMEQTGMTRDECIADAAAGNAS
ncbi:hypothetical protein GCM10010210_54290 [Pseudonocardia hydrocarbonoxydans]|uniref:Uncharacterized protein n=1 Tax=Pseudonocardia hydrocarbonoxydans TaxID=76726 RepID=A0A4Y3WS53_9PSEU|nr:hypothetical protein PHY01_34040 [Pseudonocardia hydrocarbonoxydans]